MQISVRFRDFSALVVLLLVGKNATWSVMTGHFINPVPLPSIFWWYGLCALHHALTARHLDRPSRLGHLLAAVAGWGGCAASLVLAWLFLTEVSGTSGQPVAEWYDFVQLALAFVCAAVTERAGSISCREDAG
jgi:hypothetical protein